MKGLSSYQIFYKTGWQTMPISGTVDFTAVSGDRLMLCFSNERDICNRIYLDVIHPLI